MQIIDIRTLTLVCTIVSAVVSIAFGVALLNFPGSSRDTAWFGCGFLSQAAGFLLIFLRGRVPILLSGPLANTLLVAGLVMLSWGVDVHAEERPRYAPGLAWVAVSAVLFIFVTYGQPRYNLRVVAVSALLLAINGAIGIRLLRRRNDAAVQHLLTGSIFLASAAAMAVRGFLAMFGPSQDTPFVSSPSSVVGFLAAFVMPILVAIGLLSMVARKMQVEREQTIGDREAARGRITALGGLLPICASCKKIRDEAGHWHEVEVYVRRHSPADFSHTLCPSCAGKLYPDLVPGAREKPL